MTRQEAVQKNLSQKRQPARLAGKLDKKLVTYALVATAAGVSMIAVSNDADASVVSKPVDITVPINGGLVQFDINGDGIPDFGLSATSFVATNTGVRRASRPPLGGFFGGKLTAIPAQSANRVVKNGSYGIRPCAAAMAGGAKVGPSLTFEAGPIDMAGILGTGCAGSSFAYCNWKGTHPPHAFLGVKFTDSAGSVHYGWVRINVHQSNTIQFSATITGFAYETTPNKPITAGATHGPVSDATMTGPENMLASKLSAAAGLGMLALGAPGLEAWRKDAEREQEAA